MRCKLQLHARVKKDKWHVTVIRGEPNLPTTLDIADYAAARRQNKYQKPVVELNIKAGMPSRAALTALRQQFFIVSTSFTVSLFHCWSAFSLLA